MHDQNGTSITYRSSNEKARRQVPKAMLRLFCQYELHIKVYFLENQIKLFIVSLLTLKRTFKYKYNLFSHRLIRCLLDLNDLIVHVPAHVSFQQVVLMCSRPQKNKGSRRHFVTYTYLVIDVKSTYCVDLHWWI